MNKTVSFYLIITIVILSAIISHPTMTSLLVEGINAGLLFILRDVAQKEGRTEIEHTLEEAANCDHAHKIG